MPAEPPAWASRWIGLPFADGGRGPKAYDCYGLARAVVAERLHVELPLWDGYESTQDREGLAYIVRGARREFEPVVSPRECDLVLFRVVGLPCHLGVVVADAWFLHGLRGVGSVLERWDSPMWRHRVEGFYRWAT